MTTKQRHLAALALLSGSLLGTSLSAAADTGLPFRSGFDAGTGEWNGSVRGGIEIVDGAARTPLYANTLNDNYIEHTFGDHARERGDKVEEVYLGFRSRFDGGYLFPHRAEHKLAILNLTDGNTWQRRFQIYVSVDNQGRYQVTQSNIANWRFHSLRQNRGEPAAVRFDQWDELKLHVRLNAPGRADGVVQLWVNGELKLDHTGLDLRGNTRYGLTTLILSSYTTGQSGGDGAQWWDDWQLSESDLAPPAPVPAPIPVPAPVVAPVPAPIATPAPVVAPTVPAWPQIWIPGISTPEPQSLPWGLG